MAALGGAESWSVYNQQLKGFVCDVKINETISEHKKYAMTCESKFLLSVLETCINTKVLALAHENQMTMNRAPSFEY